MQEAEYEHSCRRAAYVSAADNQTAAGRYDVVCHASSVRLN